MKYISHIQGDSGTPHHTAHRLVDEISWTGFNSSPIELTKWLVLVKHVAVDVGLHFNNGLKDPVRSNNTEPQSVRWKLGENPVKESWHVPTGQFWIAVSCSPWQTPANGETWQQNVPAYRPWLWGVISLVASVAIKGAFVYVIHSLKTLPSPNASLIPWTHSCSEGNRC